MDSTRWIISWPYFVFWYYWPQQRAFWKSVDWEASRQSKIPCLKWIAACLKLKEPQKSEYSKTSHMHVNFYSKVQYKNILLFPRVPYEVKVLSRTWTFVTKFFRCSEVWICHGHIVTKFRRHEVTFALIFGKSVNLIPQVINIFDCFRVICFT